MTKIKNNSPLVNITSTDQVKFVGDIPTCALTGDCLIDETNLIQWIFKYDRFNNDKKNC